MIQFKSPLTPLFQRGESISTSPFRKRETSIIPSPFCKGGSRGIFWNDEC